MKYVCVIFLILACAALIISAGPPPYVPRAYYTIDENGNANPLHYLNSDKILRRLKRTSVSSSSSSSSLTDGSGVQYFTNSGTAANDHYGTYQHSTGLVVPPGKVYITGYRAGVTGK